MNRYPTTRQHFSDLLITTFKAYPRALITLFPFAILLGLMSGLCFYIPYLSGLLWVRLLVNVLVLLVQVFLWSASLVTMDHYFRGEEKKVGWACTETGKRIGSIYAGFFLSILICCATFFVGYYIVKTIGWIAPQSTSLYAVLVFLFISLPLLAVAVWLILFLPQLAVMKKSVWAALKDSVRWVGFRNWVVTFILYVYVLILVFLVYPDAQHLYWLHARFLAIPFDIFIYLVFLPFLVNYTLLLLNRIQK